MLLQSAGSRSGLLLLDYYARDIVYFVAEREASKMGTTVSDIIFNERFGSLGTAQRRLNALVTGNWLEARRAPDDARRKEVRLMPHARNSIASSSAYLLEHLSEKGSDAVT